MSSERLVVLKFGGSVLLDEARMRVAVHEIYRFRRDGLRVVAVVSALAGRTDQLLAQAATLGVRPSDHTPASILATGEFESARLLGMQLERAGVPGRVLMPQETRLIAAGDALDAVPTSLDAGAVQSCLACEGVVVIPGYVAIDRTGRSVVLGRGGSDLTAIFFAQRLSAQRCRLIKDVDGLYDRDPASSAAVRRYSYATYEDALSTDGTIVQRKAVCFARDHRIEFELGRFNSDAPTVIGRGPTRYDAATRDTPPVRIGLLGFGVVGGGVYRLLRTLTNRFRVTGVVTRGSKHGKATGARAPLFARDVEELLARGVDIVVEAIGGTAAARTAIQAALRSGASVVTSNKAVLAEHGRRLREIARGAGVGLIGGASVGGSAPVLERLAAKPRGSVRSIRAILNGTANFVLSRCAAGIGFDDAVVEAQRRGLTEADPARDLTGVDAADKLRVIADYLGLERVAARQVARDELTEASVRRALCQEGRPRHVAYLATNKPPGVRLLNLSENDPLATIEHEENAAMIESIDGSVEMVRGKGAGRWPTAEAVVADLLQIERERNAAVRESGLQDAG